jgi:O-antigen ligase
MDQMYLKVGSHSIFMWYESIVATVILMIVFLNIPEYTYSVVNQSILPKYFYFGICAIVTPILFLKFVQLMRYLISPFSLLMLVLICINFSDLIDSSADVKSLIFTRNQFLLLAIILGFVFSTIQTECYKYVFPLLMIVNLVSVLVDFFIPGLIHPIDMPGTVIGRAAGTFINPTQMSEVLLIICLFAIPGARDPYRILLILLAGIGVTLTFTRGSFIVGFLFFIILSVTRKIPKSAFVFLVCLLCFLPILLANFSDYLLSRDDLIYDVDNILNRLDFFQSFEINDFSALERLEVMDAAVNLFFQNPLLGAGVGSTSLWSYKVGPHNQILVLAAENGIIGLLLWGSLAMILWRGHYFQDRTFQHTACFIFIAMSMFTHNILEFPYWLLSIALISQRDPV